MKDLCCITSQILIMQQQEREQAYICIDYLSYRTDLCSANRQALCNWAYQRIAAFTGVNRLTVVKAISYFDRYMSTSSEDRGLEAIQLAFVTSLVIALKVDAGFNVELDFFANVVLEDAYDKEEIERMEMKILRALGWRLSGPTPHDFIDRFLRVIPRMEAMHRAFLNRFSKAVVELAIVNYSIALRYPSVIAFGAICCSLEYLESIFAIDSITIERSLEIVSGLNCNDPSQQSAVETMVRIMLDIPLDNISSFIGRGETDGMSASSQDSHTSIFHAP